MNHQTTGDRDGAPLKEKLLASITRHLNQDHMEDLLACAQANASVDWAEQAKVIHLDAAGITIEVSNHQNIQSVHLEFPAPAKGVLSLKRLTTTMVTESRAKLGWPKAANEHTDD
ncbi:MAG: DUF2470 domain-containing protein [Cyanothece sp. SIO2G6]|nr:DUF2470 domain-containing protein [Cyanothece sp. SIO2G6]